MQHHAGIAEADRLLPVHAQPVQYLNSSLRSAYSGSVDKDQASWRQSPPRRTRNDPVTCRPRAFAPAGCRCGGMAAGPSAMEVDGAGPSDAPAQKAAASASSSSYELPWVRLPCAILPCCLQASHACRHCLTGGCSSSMTEQRCSAATYIHPKTVNKSVTCLVGMRGMHNNLWCR